MTNESQNQSNQSKSTPIATKIRIALESYRGVPGVYEVLQDGVVVYVGSTKDLQAAITKWAHGIEEVRNGWYPPNGKYAWTYHALATGDVSWRIREVPTRFTPKSYANFLRRLKQPLLNHTYDTYLQLTGTSSSKKQPPKKLF